MKSTLNTTETIFARGTVAGESALAVVRVSGPQTLPAIKALFKSRGVKPLEQSPRVMQLGRFVDGKGKLIDTGLLVYFAGPRSYTGEDLAEFHLHGSELVVELIYERLLDLGLRLARPGEFTRRAFLNGKMDLAQAESVIQIIHAGSRSALDAAHRVLKGELSEKLGDMKSDCLEVISLLELSIDFPEEDIIEASDDELLNLLQRLLEGGRGLLRGCSDGELLRRGIHVALIGAPNAGKSSLLNALTGQSKALVSDIAGTTRDVVESRIRLQGEPIILQDTAGIRASDDPIEQMGVARSLAIKDSADLILLVVDGQMPPNGSILKECADENVLLVLNKSDLGIHRDWRTALSGNQGLQSVEISALDLDGIQPVISFLEGRIRRSRSAMHDALVLSEWQKSCVADMVKELEGAIESIEFGLSPEATAIHLYAVLDLINGFLGADSQDDILDKIFSKFCLGK